MFIILTIIKKKWLNILQIHQFIVKLPKVPWKNLSALKQLFHVFKLLNFIELHWMRSGCIQRISPFCFDN